MRDGIRIHEMAMLSTAGLLSRLFSIPLERRSVRRKAFCGELKPVMHIIHILTSKMIHFLHQTQYYFLFEVLECSWAEMQNQVNKAECLDDIIAAHMVFLSSIQRGVFRTLQHEHSVPAYTGAALCSTGACPLPSHSSTVQPPLRDRDRQHHIPAFNSQCLAGAAIALELERRGLKYSPKVNSNEDTAVELCNLLKIEIERTYQTAFIASKSVCCDLKGWSSTPQKQLFSHLISIYNFVVNLEAHQEALYQAAMDEYNAYTEYQKKINAENGYGTTAEEQAAAKMRVATFHQFLNTTKLKVKTSAQTYDVIVKNFLELLSKSMNMNLRLLSVRLSFNNFYNVA
ncbi:hypothetical protein NQ318_005615 [Aromia moschata]|uniref:Gamma tubulin complex component C-terminal domain-containing protein n=1 Tax=Aromia moschata TaxID=1265417 RepID=A0AAV8XTT7_9CUCU|nr:hypothetical protein NQ318_005615 [Aromia moschata]